MRVLSFIVEDQMIRKDPACDFTNLISGTGGYLKARFVFNQEWRGYTTIAIKSWALFNRDEADNIHINGVVTDQNVSIEGKISGSNQIIIPPNAFVEVLYLVN